MNSTNALSFRSDETPRTRSAALLSRIASHGAVVACLVGSAALLSVEVATRSHPWLAWLTLLPLLGVIRVCKPRRALIYGAIWGSALGVFLVARTEPLIAATVQGSLLLAAVPAVFALLSAWITRRYGFNPLALGFGWAAVELALLPLGLQGGLLAGTYEHESGGLLSLLQGAFGYVCMAGFIVAANGIILVLLSRAYVGGGAMRRYVRVAEKKEQRLFRVEVPINSRYHSDPHQPRAPPLPAF